MENTKIQSDFQFLDSYITNSKIHILKKKNCEKNLELSVEVKISEIKKKKSELRAEMRLKNYVKIYDKTNNDELINLEVEMAGIFLGNNMTEEEFMKYIKYSGTPILSQSIRAFIMSMSALSGIDTIRLPLINYVKYFENPQTTDK